MNLSMVEKIASAVLYEGYILYPYRASAVKNQQRFNFGALYPDAYSQAQKGADASSMQTECLVVREGRALLDVNVRFLQLLAREVGKFDSPALELEGAESDCHIVDAIEIGGKLFQTWQEAIERDVKIAGLDLNGLASRKQQFEFSFPAKREIEPLRDSTNKIAAVIVRKQDSVKGVIEVAAENIKDALFKLTVRVMNSTDLTDAKNRSRDEALLRSLVSTHTILGIRAGEFVSLLDPQEEFRLVAALCNNVGTWPVLVGAEGERDCMLSSPIILYDYPQIAPESAGDLYDGTEIDEILTLRILTLTDEEKREMRETDERARKILERTETLPMDQLMKMHGAVRGLKRQGRE